MWKIAIVEDEAKAAETLMQCLQTYGEQKGTAFDTVHFANGGEFLKEYRPVYDLIFMDIKMPGLNGMAAAHQLRELDSVTALVFVTNMVQYAVKGYEVDALDFIVKPVQYPTFEMKMNRVLKALEMKKGADILLNVKGVTRVLPSSELQFIEVMDHDLTYHTEQGDFVVRGKLGAVEQQLPRDSFFRCSASHLINLRYVTWFDGDVIGIKNHAVRVSRGKKKELMAALAAYLGRGGEK